MRLKTSAELKKTKQKAVLRIIPGAAFCFTFFIILLLLYLFRFGNCIHCLHVQYKNSFFRGNIIR